MTRINLIPVEQLTDQHLFAEFREIKMVPKALGRTIRSLQRRGLPVVPGVLERVLPAYTLGQGHVSFFYDKGAFLAYRYELLRIELTLRRVRFNPLAVLDPDGVFEQYPELNGHYHAPPEAVAASRARIDLRISQKPQWYRMRGKRVAVPALQGA